MTGYVQTMLLAAAVIAAAAPAGAQSLSAGAEVTNDEVRRGLSWSEGRAAISADALASFGGFDASARITTTRGSARHDGADAVADLAVGTGWDFGAIRVQANATAHLFSGAGTRMDYVELGGSAAFTLGPGRLTGGAIYAPSQDAIGGDNLYLYAGADAGIPGTALTLIGEIGHSTGDIDDPVRIQRLRPAGSYTDWRLGVEHRRGPLTIGLAYAATDIDQDQAFGPFADAAHAGDRVVGRVRLDF